MDAEYRRFLVEQVVPYVEAMTRLLHSMGENAAAWRERPEPRGNVAEFLLDRPGYSVRIICRPGGIRPFLGFLERPWPHKAFLGRLHRNGSVHVSDYGLKVFFNFLWEEGVAERFTADVEEAVRRFAALADRPSPASREPLPGGAEQPSDRDAPNN